jgi:hypothetical protein
MGQNERQDRLAKEREEIMARVAKFRAMQQQFTRERESYATTTWKKALPNQSMK